MFVFFGEFRREGGRDTDREQDCAANVGLFFSHRLPPLLFFKQGVCRAKNAYARAESEAGGGIKLMTD